MRIIPLTALLLLPTVALAGAKASAFKKDAKLGNNYWAANAAVDGKTDTAWQLPGESETTGEWLELSIPGGTVDKVAIFPGYGKDAKTFTDYARPKVIRVDVRVQGEEDEAKVVGTAKVTVADKAEMQLLDIPDVQTGEGIQRYVRLTIEEFYPGEDYPSLLISEACVIMAEFDAKVTISAASAEVAGKGKDLALDENPKTVFGTQAGAELSLSMGTFSVSSVGFLAAGKDMARPKTVEITTGPVTQTRTLADKPGEVQWAALPYFNGYNGGFPGDFTVKIVDTYPGTKSQDIGIAELKARATSAEAF
jgi:hypothetical protein